MESPADRVFKVLILARWLGDAVQGGAAAVCGCEQQQPAACRVESQAEGTGSADEVGYQWLGSGRPCQQRIERLIKLCAIRNVKAGFAVPAQLHVLIVSRSALSRPSAPRRRLGGPVGTVACRRRSPATRHAWSTSIMSAAGQGVLSAG